MTESLTFKGVDLEVEGTWTESESSTGYVGGFEADKVLFEGNDVTLIYSEMDLLGDIQTKIEEEK